MREPEEIAEALLSGEHDPEAPVHELKTWPEPFAALASGHKQYEIRKNDRDYQIDDELDLREWNPLTELYSGRSIRAIVLHMTPGGCFGIPDEMCVLGLCCIEEIDNT